MKSEENMFAEFYNSTRDLISDRLSSPFIFSFIVTFLISNYKIVMVIFTNQSESFVFDYKIQLIESYLNLTHGLIYPFIGACFYTFLYPFIDQLITSFTLKRKLAIRNDKNKIEKTQLLTAEEVKAIHLRHFKVEQDYKLDIENARATESQLRAQIDNIQKRLTSLASIEAKVAEKAAINLKHNINIKKSLANLGKQTITEKQKLPIASQGLTIDINKAENTAAMSKSEITELINKLNTKELRVIKFMGDYQKNNSRWLERSSMHEGNLPDFEIATLSNQKIIKGKTNPRTLNKIYELSDKGAQVYKELGVS